MRHLPGWSYKGGKMKVKRINDNLTWDVFENRKRKMFRSNKTMNNGEFLHWEATRGKIGINQEKWTLQLIRTTSRNFRPDEGDVMQEINTQELRDAMKFAEKKSTH